MVSPAEAVAAPGAAETTAAEAPAAAAGEANRHIWRSGPIHIAVATSLTDDTPQQIDFASTIGHSKNCPRAGKRTDANCHWLPSSLNQNVDAFRQRRVHPMFVRACHAAGFLIHGGYHEEGQCIRFECNRANFRLAHKEAEYQAKRKRNVIDPSKPPGKRPNRKSARPSKEKGDATCKFKFSVYWDERLKRWFVPKQQKGCLEHCGHARVDPMQLPLQARFAVPKDERDDEGETDASVPAEVSGTSGSAGIPSAAAAVDVNRSRGQKAAANVQSTEKEGARASAGQKNSRKRKREAASTLPDVSTERGATSYDIHRDNLFREICAMADANGPEGRRALWRGLERIGDELTRLGQNPGGGQDASVHHV